MEIDKDQIQKIINQMEASERPFYDACKMLKELIEPKWEPKEYKSNFNISADGRVIKSTYLNKDYRLYGNEFPTKELAETARDMNKRNQLILQAKHEMGYGDGIYCIEYNSRDNRWSPIARDWKHAPELTFETKDEAEIVIKMVGLND